MDFNALQHKLFALDPSDPAEDLRKLTESAGSSAQKNVAETVDYVQESVEVQQGTMPVAGDYSLGDFAALAGVTLTEAQRKGPAGQAKGKDPMPKTSKPSRTGEQPHPLKDKLVGEDNDRIAQLEARVAQLEAMLQEENKGLYHNVNKRKKAGTSRKQGHPKAPTAQAWKDAAKTAKKESVESIKDMLYRKLNDKK